MDNVVTTTFVVRVLMVMCILAGTPATSAGSEAECRQEAEDYEIMPELRDEYITGCIESRGGVSIPVGTEADYLPPPESDDGTSPEVGDQDPAE